MITLVAAISKNNCIGKKGDLPWNIPEDMKRMRAFTKNKVLIMGRKTWESIPEKRRPLPERTNVVITRNAEYQLPEGAVKFSSIEAALEAYKGQEIVSFGGTRVFHDMIKYADALEITHVDQEVDGCDAFFPVIDMTIWKEVSREDHDGFAFSRYERKQ
jgi:dihydrofolate reductase